MAITELVGRWRLVCWSARTANGKFAHPLGERAEGSLVYTPGGWMTVTIAKAERESLSTADVTGGSETERATAYSGYVAYCGTYEVEGNLLIHRVRMSLFPNWVGSAQERTFELSGDELVLRSPPVEVAGQLVVSELRWTREE